MATRKPRLQINEITKVFPGVIALERVSFNVLPGEVHAICGENGAGKSTLMKVLTGNLQPEEGHILLDGKRIDIDNQLAARKLGISIVYQERSLVNDLNVAENIFAGNQPVGFLGLINRKKLYADTEAILQQLSLNNIHSKTKVGNLTPALQQMIEIAKALSQQPNILILDEPTAAITEIETKVLFNIIRALKKKGVSIIYISHRMAEIFDIADRVTILKDGKYQGTSNIEEINVDQIIKKMVGRELQKKDYHSFAKETFSLELKHLSGSAFNNISFQLKKGEILGLAGLVGAGRTEIARVIIGADQRYSGEVFLQGKKVDIQHPADALQLGLGYLPEHRKEQGLFLEQSVGNNIVVSNLKSTAKKGFINNSSIEEITSNYIAKLNIKTTGSTQRAVNLSGGNQQKLILARWLLCEPNIFIVDEPTHGIDVGAKAEIYDLLKSLAERGMSILLISSELPEILTLSDRILVLHNGSITAELNKAQATEEEIMHYASGTKNMFEKTVEDN